MSFLFGRKPNLNDKNRVWNKILDIIKLSNKKFNLFHLKKKKTPLEQDLNSNLEIGAFQPKNPFKDLILLPYFDRVVRHVCVLSDKKRFVIWFSIIPFLNKLKIKLKFNN
jgi:hypothetical protein